MSNYKDDIAREYFQSKFAHDRVSPSRDFFNDIVQEVDKGTSAEGAHGNVGSSDSGNNSSFLKSTAFKRGTFILSGAVIVTIAFLWFRNGPEENHSLPDTSSSKEAPVHEPEKAPLIHEPENKHQNPGEHQINAFPSDKKELEKTPNIDAAPIRSTPTITNNSSQNLSNPATSNKSNTTSTIDDAHQPEANTKKPESSNISSDEIIEPSVPQEGAIEAAKTVIPDAKKDIVPETNSEKATAPSTEPQKATTPSTEAQKATPPSTGKKQSYLDSLMNAARKKGTNKIFQKK